MLMRTEHEFYLGPECVKFALESVGMGTWEIDLQNDTVQCSPEMLKLWEINPEEFTGERKTLQARVLPEDLEVMKQAIEKAIQEKNIYDLEYRLSLPSGLKWVRSRGRLIYGSDSDVPVKFTGVVFDITDLKKKDAALALALQAKEEFLSQASHELRNPLTSLSLLGKVFKSEVDKFLDPEKREHFHSLLSKQDFEIHRIEAIIRKIFKNLDS